MDKSEIVNRDQADIAFMYLVAKTVTFKLTLNMVMIENEYTKKGYLANRFTFYTTTNKGTDFTESFLLFDKHALLFLQSLTESYPTIQIIDNRTYKE